MALRCTATNKHRAFNIGPYTSAQGCGLGLDVSVSRWSRDVPSHLGLVSRKTVNVSVSANYVSCPRPIFGQIVQATLIKRVNFGRHGMLHFHSRVSRCILHSCRVSKSSVDRFTLLTCASVKLNVKDNI